MLLGRLRVREKLALLVVLPLVAMILATIPFVLDRVQTVVKDRRSADVVGHTVQLSKLIQEVQQERLLALGFLGTGSGRDRLVVRAAQVDDTTALLRGELAEHMNSALDSALTQAVSLRKIRGRVLLGRIPPDLAFVAYSEVIANLINVVGLSADADARTPTGQQEVALDALIRHDEASAAVGAALLVPLSRRVSAHAVSLVAGASAAENSQEQVFFNHASPIAKSLYVLVQEGPARQYVKRYQDLLVNAPAEAIRLSRLPPALLPNVESVTELDRLVQLKIANDARRQAASTARTAAVSAIVVIVLALLLLALVVLLSILVARAIAAPLRQLTLSAEEVAEVAQAELTRVADTEETEIGVSKLQLVPVPVATADELGELARAFNRVQQVAGELVERQLVSRRNVATMFGNVGRRTQNLVGRQLAMIDALEHGEQDPAMLERLYRLDHVSSRLRRNANSLVVLSGSAEPSIASEPLSVGDAIRSALGEIEDFQRVRLHRVHVLHLAPDAASDVVLLLAELLENSTSFSPPHTEVEVSVARHGEDCLVRIIDRGIGMTDEQLAEENARLVERERLDLAPTDVLGLFVVGRLARRHGIRVTLSPTPGSGVTAAVTIPDRLLVRGQGADNGARPTGGPGWSRGRTEMQPPQLPVRVPTARPAGGQVPAQASPAAATAAGPAHIGPKSLAGPKTPAGPRSLAGPKTPAGPELPVAPDAPTPPEPPGVGVPAAPEVRPARIIQRVPGAQVSPTGGGSPQTPDAARQTIEDFQAGVARAEADGVDDAAEASLLDRWERLRRRVPDTPEPVGASPPSPAPAVAGHHADTARALVEEFEQGVRRALDNLAAVTARHAGRQQMDSGAGSPPPLPSPRPGAEPGRNVSRVSGDGRATGSDSGTSAAAPDGGWPAPGPSPAQPGPPSPPAPRGSPAQPGRSIPPAPPGRSAPAAPGQPRLPAQPGPSAPFVPPTFPTAVAGRSGPPGPPGPPAPPGQPARPGPSAPFVPPASPDRHPDGISLTRRVPGAQLPDTGAAPGRPAAPAAQLPSPPAPSAQDPQDPQDPQAARALVDEFEAGVARALRSVGDGSGTTATTEGDEG